MAVVKITEYTDTDKIRSALGFDASDARDALLSAAGLDISLEHDLDEWLPTHAAIWAAGTAGTVTASEKKLAQALGMYAQWFCAHLVASKQMLFIQIFSDGKSQMNRFDIDVDSVRLMCEAERNAWKDKLQELDGQTPTASSFNPVGISTPTFDPITG